MDTRQQNLPELLDDDWSEWFHSPDARIACVVEGCGKTSPAYLDDGHEVLTWTECAHRGYIPESPLLWPPPESHIRSEKEWDAGELDDDQWEAWIASPEALLKCPRDGCGQVSAAYWNGVDERLRWPQCGHFALIPEEPEQWPAHAPPHVRPPGQQ